MESPAALNLPLAPSSDCELKRQVYSGLQRLPFLARNGRKCNGRMNVFKNGRMCFALCRPQQISAPSKVIQSKTTKDNE
jgi:hypothetical protein